MSCVVALGQPLASDDGVAWIVLEQLRARAPLGVELVFARDSTVLIDRIQHTDRLILVDALLLPPAGQVRLLSLDEITSVRTTSAHGIGAAEAIALGRAFSSSAVDVRIVAITIERPHLSEGLSPRVAAAMERAADTVLDLLRR